MVVITGVKMCAWNYYRQPWWLRSRFQVCSVMLGFFLLDDNSIVQFKEETKTLPRLIIFTMGCDCWHWSHVLNCLKIKLLLWTFLLCFAFVGWNWYNSFLQNFGRSVCVNCWPMTWVSKFVITGRVVVHSGVFSLRREIGVWIDKRLENC